jgi:uncharacterized protein with HEPN domain
LKRDRERLEDILEAIERIEKYASGGRASFDRDELVVAAKQVVHSGHRWFASE